MPCLTFQSLPPCPASLSQPRIQQQSSLLTAIAPRPQAWSVSVYTHSQGAGGSMSLSRHEVLPHSCPAPGLTLSPGLQLQAICTAGQCPNTSALSFLRTKIHSSGDSPITKGQDVQRGVACTVPRAESVDMVLTPSGVSHKTLTLKTPHYKQQVAFP